MLKITEVEEVYAVADISCIHVSRVMAVTKVYRALTFKEALDVLDPFFNLGAPEKVLRSSSMVERRPVKARVAGSSPASAAKPTRSYYRTRKGKK